MAIYIRRREFIGTLGGAAAAWPLVARAQQPDGVRRIGVLMGYAESDSDAQAWYAAFQEGLQKLRWTAGRNTQIDTRWATPDDAESMRRFAKELVALQPDLILSSTTPTTSALLQQTHTIPIVFAIVADPIGSGFVANFARAAPVRDRSELETVIAAQAREPNGGLIVMPDSFTDAHRVEITSLAARYRLPVVYPFRFFAEVGGLLSYGVDRTDNFRRAAAYVDRILKGEKPAELPVQAP